MVTITSRSRADFQHKLLAIREDPEVRGLALRRAVSPEVAEDALQSAYYAVSRVANPGAIENLRAYFCRKLINEIYRELGQQHAAAVEDFTDLADTRQGRPGSISPAPRPFPEEVNVHLQGRGWLGAFTARRGELAARVPRRSPDPARYQLLVVRVAEHMLSAILGEKADADVNAVLRGGYAEWFAARDSSENTQRQRLWRARTDVCALLKTIIERGDLIP